MLTAKASTPLVVGWVVHVAKCGAVRGAEDRCGHCVVAASDPVRLQSPCSVWQPRPPPLSHSHGGRGWLVGPVCGVCGVCVCVCVCAWKWQRIELETYEHLSSYGGHQLLVSSLQPIMLVE